MEKINSTEVSKAAEELLKMQGSNPAQGAEKTVAERRRVPMTRPMQRLEVTELPGYWLQWIRGTPERVQQAERAGFTFVRDHELEINNLDLGGDAKVSGNTDLGSVVSTGDGSGQVGHDGQPIRLYLMKQRKEHHDEDAGILQERNDSVVDALAANFRTGRVGVGAEGAPSETSEDVKQRYVGTQSKLPHLFQRKSSRS